MGTSTDRIRYVVDAGTGIVTSYGVIDTFTGNTVYRGSSDAANEAAKALNAGFNADFERNRGMLLAFIKVVVKQHDPNRWSIRPSDFGASVLSEDGQLVAECTDGDEAIALCEFARQAYAELNR